MSDAVTERLYCATIAPNMHIMIHWLFCLFEISFFLLKKKIYIHLFIYICFIVLILCGGCEGALRLPQHSAALKCGANSQL